jgi:hypothetical protein
MLSSWVIQGLVVEEFEFDDVAFFGEEFDDGDAAVLDVEVGHAGEGEVEEEAEDDADDAAVAEDDGATWAGLGKDAIEAGADAFFEVVGGFAAGEFAFVEDLEPVEGADAEEFFDFIPTKAGPFAKVDFAEVIEQDGGDVFGGEEWGHGLLDAEHGAGVNGVDLVSAEPLSDGGALGVAERGEGHVDFGATEDFVIGFFDLAMADEDQLEGVIGKMELHGVGTMT